jgi:hypothetical protein
MEDEVCEGGVLLRARVFDELKRDAVEARGLAELAVVQGL